MAAPASASNSTDRAVSSTTPKIHCGRARFISSSRARDALRVPEILITSFPEILITSLPEILAG
jgi:hypothetical protein